MLEVHLFDPCFVASPGGIDSLYRCTAIRRRFVHVRRSNSLFYIQMQYHNIAATVQRVPYGCGAWERKMRETV